MRNSTTTMTLAITGCLLGGCLVQLPGNLDGAGGDDDSTGEDGESNSEDGMDGDGDGDGDPADPGPIDGDGCQSAVDILLVLDNSGSMGEEQALLASALIDPLLSPLDLDGIDWRLAITTTDVGGNPWCPPSSVTPEDGHFQLQACNDHLEDFVFNNGDVDVQDVACNEICPYLPGKLHTLPTTTADDPEPKPRPWLERIGGESNLPDDIDPVAAALCVVPQGINGCGFEQPLEAMGAALELANTPGNAETGFLRDEASLLVIFITDEVDCSHADTSIFEQEGDRAFWSDPQSAFPTSAVCWNAGVSCVGDPDGYDDCMATNYDTQGNQTMPDLAVLHPVSRYAGMLDELEQQKRALDPGADVGVLVIGGLGTDGQLHYADVKDTDPNFQDSFGVGPGCEAMGPGGELAQALPPVRLREVGQAMTSDPLASICAPSYVDTLSGVYERLIGGC